jgi:hypothetical protein
MSMEYMAFYNRHPLATTLLSSHTLHALSPDDPFLQKCESFAFACDRDVLQLNARHAHGAPLLQPPSN